MAEALDAVKDSRPSAGVHILATAILCAAGATADELELARRLLERDPKEPAAREAEDVADCFNRQMDALIDGSDRTRGYPTRAGRRAKLAALLDLEGLIVVDRNYLAGLIADRMTLELERAACNTDGEDLGAELLDGEEPSCDLERLFDPRPFSEVEQKRWSEFTCGEGDFVGDVGRNPLGDYANPNVND